MKLLVFAHTPPPRHGQSTMVAALIDGLRPDPEVTVLHVNARLSRDTSDIGGWRAGKALTLLRWCFAAWVLRWRHGPCVFYYVPAPARRSALYRDFTVMLLCRPFFPQLVLHWHAAGVGTWLADHATAVERWLAQRLLGRPDLSIVLAPELAHDAAFLNSQRIAVVPNGAPDPGPPPAHRPLPPNAPGEVLFLGLCTHEKGLFDTIDAIELAHRAAPGRFRLTVAGGFANREGNREFHARIAALPHGLVHYAGFADEKQKRLLFSRADAFCLPPTYPHEGQPLALVEALANDVPIVTTRWRAIPGMLPADSSHVWFVEPNRPSQIADALLAASHAARPDGALRRHYLAHFTPERHLSCLKTALLSLQSPPAQPSLR